MKPILRRPRVLFLFHVALAEIEPPIWRRVAVPGSLTLHDLHRVLQILFGWEGTHLYQFEIAGTVYEDPNPDDRPKDVPDPRQAILAALAPAQGATFTYTYDFGDDWRHDLTVEGVVPLPAGLAGPTLLGGARSGPPEDVGGPHGYARFVGALRRPTSVAATDAKMWLGRRYDPEAWDPRAVNSALARGFPVLRPAVPRARRRSAG